jgi:hypothetical protein
LCWLSFCSQALVLRQREPRDASSTTQLKKAGVAFRMILLCSNANARIVYRHARFHGLLYQALTRFETIYHGAGNLPCKAIQLLVC